MKIAILSSSHTLNPTRQIKKAAEAKGHDVIVIDPSKLYLYISDKESGYDRLYDGYFKDVHRINIKDIDAIIPRIGRNVGFASSIVDHFTENLGIFSTQSGEAIRTASDKLKTLQRCSAYGIRTPRTIFVDNPKHIDFCIEKLGLPLVVKLLNGSQGIGVSVLQTELTAKSTLQSYFKTGSKVIMQEYIKSKGEDIRAIVIGNKVVAAYKRSAPRKDFRANLSLGGSGAPVTLSEADKQFCVRCAKAVGLNVAGVDIMKDKKRNSYCIEVNSNYGFKIQNITGVNIADEMIKYVEANYKAKSDKWSLHNELIREQKTTNLLREQLEKTIQHNNFFTKNPQIKAVFNKAKGNTVDYVDRNMQKKTVRINTTNDIYKIIFDTFKID